MISKILEKANHFRSSGQKEGELKLYRDWLLDNMNDPLAYLIWYGHARVQGELGFWPQAELSFREVLLINPTLTQASLGLGRALEAQGKIKDAEEVWKRALSARDIQIELLNNLGRILDMQWRHEEAEEFFLDSLRLDPNQVDVVTTLCHLRRRQCAWPCLSDAIKIKDIPEYEQMGPICSLAHCDDPVFNLMSAKSLLRRKGWDERFDLLTPKNYVYKNHNRIRIGFLSADIRLHATSIFFAPLIENLSKEDFEIFIFDITVAPKIYDDGMCKRIINSCDHYFPLQSISDYEAAQLIKKMKLTF